MKNNSLNKICFAILFILVFCYSNSAFAEECCLRVPMQYGTDQRITETAGYALDPAANSYRELGFQLQKKYSYFKKNNPNLPFIISCLGDPVSGKSTLLEQLKIILETSGLKVIKVPEKKGNHSLWNSFNEMTTEYSNFDILLYETKTYLPSEEHGDNKLFISMSVNLYMAISRYDRANGYEAYRYQRGYDKTASLRNRLPDLTIDTTASNLTGDIIRDLIIMGINDEIKYRSALVSIDTGYKKLGEILSEAYLKHKKSGKNRPFIAMFKGAGGVGKSTLIEAIKRRMEDFGLKVVEPGKVAWSDLRNYNTWTSYKQIIDNNPKADIILCEFTDVFPASHDYREFLDLFVEIQSERAIQENRLRAKGIAEETLKGITAGSAVPNYEDRSPDLVIVNKKSDGGWFTQDEMDELFSAGLATANFEIKLRTGLDVAISKDSRESI